MHDFTGAGRIAFGIFAFATLLAGCWWAHNWCRFPFFIFALVLSGTFVERLVLDCIVSYA